VPRSCKHWLALSPMQGNVHPWLWREAHSLTCHPRMHCTHPSSLPGEPVPPKFFGNFPYPYMNGLLHLGHAFTISKVRFAAVVHGGG
jgi:hypothetical protein